MRADPQKPPLVAGPYLRHAQDGKVLAWAMRELRGIMSLLGGTGAKPDSSTAANATVTELLPGADGSLRAHKKFVKAAVDTAMARILAEGGTGGGPDAASTPCSSV